MYHNVYVPPHGGLTIRKVTFGGVGSFSYAVTASPTPGEVHQAQATTDGQGVPVDAVPSLINLAPGHYVIAEQTPTSPDGRWHLLHVSCNGASRSTTTVRRRYPQRRVRRLHVRQRVRPARLDLDRENHRGRHRHYVVQGRAGGRTARAVSAGRDDHDPGVAADAAPNRPADATDHLRLGTYHIVEQPPLSSTGDWALTTVVCNGVALPFAQGTATIALTHRVPDVHCVFTNAFSATPLIPRIRRRSPRTRRRSPRAQRRGRRRPIPAMTSPTWSSPSGLGRDRHPGAGESASGSPSRTEDLTRQSA